VVDESSVTGGDKAGQDVHKPVNGQGVTSPKDTPLERGKSTPKVPIDDTAIPADVPSSNKPDDKFRDKKSLVDEGLNQIIQAWDHRSETVKVGIIAMVSASMPEDDS